MLDTALGAPGLDFAATVRRRFSDAPIECLVTPQDLLPGAPGTLGWIASRMLRSAIFCRLARFAKPSTGHYMRPRMTRH